MPKKVRKPAEIAEILAKPLSKTTDEIVEQFGNYSSGVKLAEGITPETAYEIKKLGINKHHRKTFSPISKKK